jgi:orotidine-5'-phosphate decarboxylase
MFRGAAGAQSRARECYNLRPLFNHFPAMTIYQKLNARIDRVNSLLCVGLDTDTARLPSSLTQLAFNKKIIDATLPYTCAYKLNSAFYESQGEAGWAAMRDTMAYLNEVAPDVFTIIDAKRADIGNTNLQYVTAFYDAMNADAVTLHPYLGEEAIRPFLTRPDKAPIILCHTSNPGAGELQDIAVNVDGESLPLWRYVARRVAREWNSRNNCMLVVGATVPDVMRDVRAEVGDMPILVPGIGAQGGDLEAVLAAGLTADKRGLLISASRSVIFADNPGAEAKKLQEEINRGR